MTADSCDAKGDVRDSASAAQDLDVDQLLARALRRDAEAELRGRGADLRDLEALSRVLHDPDRADLIEALRGVVRRREAAASQRESGAWDRLESSGDRIVAEQDREGAADDRAQVDRERDAHWANSATPDGGGAARRADDAPPSVRDEALGKSVWCRVAARWPSP